MAVGRLCDKWLAQFIIRKLCKHAPGLWADEDVKDLIQQVFIKFMGLSWAKGLPSKKTGQPSPFYQDGRPLPLNQDADARLIAFDCLKYCAEKVVIDRSKSLLAQEDGELIEDEVVADPTVVTAAESWSGLLLSLTMMGESQQDIRIVELKMVFNMTYAEIEQETGVSHSTCFRTVGRIGKLLLSDYERTEDD